MIFVEQGWCQVDLANQSAHAPKNGPPSASTPAHHPTLHVFSPRMRLLVQCARLQQRITIADLARTLSVSADELVAIEEGRTFPSSRMIDLLQTVLKVQLLPETSK